MKKLTIKDLNKRIDWCIGEFAINDREHTKLLYHLYIVYLMLISIVIYLIIKGI